MKLWNDIFEEKDMLKTISAIMLTAILITSFAILVAIPLVGDPNSNHPLIGVIMITGLVIAPCVGCSWATVGSRRKTGKCKEEDSL